MGIKMSVLEDIYESELFHPLKIETAEYKQALDRVCKAEDELINAYPECKELFLKYQEAENNLVHIDTRDMFVTGMRVGGRLIFDLDLKKENL